MLSRRRHSEQALTAPQQMRGVNHCVSLDGNQTATVVEEGEVYDMLDELDRPDKPDKLVRPDELEELDEPDESDEPDELDDLDEDFELLDNLLNPLVPELDSIVVLPSLTPAMMVLHDSPAGRKKSVVDLSSAVPILKKQVPRVEGDNHYSFKCSFIHTKQSHASAFLLFMPKQTHKWIYGCTCKYIVASLAILFPNLILVILLSACLEHFLL